MTYKTSLIRHKNIYKYFIAIKSIDYIIMGDKSAKNFSSYAKDNFSSY